MKSVIKKTILSFGLILLFPSVVVAQNLGLDSDIGLETVNLPTFLSFDQIQNFSFESYIALAVSLFFFLIIGVWVYMAGRAGLDIIRSEGDPDAMAQGKKRFTAIFSSISILFGFIVVVILVAGFFGLGSFWEWPRMFSKCTSINRQGEYYFNVVQEYSNLGLSRGGVDASCFGGSGGND